MNKIFLVVCILVFAVGCGGSKAPPGLCVASGKVTLAGEPLKTGTIALVPESKEAAKAGDGRQGVIQDGAYSFSEGLAIKPGQYIVRINAYKEIDKMTKGEVTPQTEDQNILRTQLVPAKYNTKSELKVELTEKGPNKHDFNLEK